MQLLLLRTIVYVADRLWIYVYRVNNALFAYSARRSHREPARTGTDVGYCFSRGDAQNVHNAIDLQALVPARRIKNRKVSRIGFAGLAMLALRASWGSGTLRGTRGKHLPRNKYGEQENAVFENHY